MAGSGNLANYLGLEKSWDLGKEPAATSLLSHHGFLATFQIFILNTGEYRFDTVSKNKNKTNFFEQMKTVAKKPN